MPDIWMDVDTALSEVPVNIFPLTDDTDFKSIEGAVAYNAAGMALRWHFVTCAGAYSVTSVTPTTGGNYDWTDQGDSGIYTIEIPASGGASINNDTEGFGWFTGSATGILPWRGPVIGFRAAGLNDLLIDNAYSTTRGLAGTALPAAAADAAGGLPISDAGGLDLDAQVGTKINSILADTGTDGVVVASIANNAITAAAIATGAIDADAIADNAIDAGAIATGAITAAKIATGAITEAKFAAGAIDAAAIANGAIDAATFAADVDAEIATMVWNAATASYGGAGTYGQAVEDILVDTGTTLDGKLDTIDDFLDTEVAAILADTNELQTDWVNGGRLDLLIDAIKAKTDSLTFTVAGDVDCNVQTWKGSAAADMTGDAYARLGAPAGASVSADVAAVKAETAAIVTDTNELQTDLTNGGRLDLILDAILEDTGTTLDGIVDSILEDTAVIGAAGAGLSAIPWNAAWDAEVQSECADALTASGLTAAGIADAVWDEASTGHTDAGKAGAQLWTDLDAVLADTDEIQAELADGGRTDLLIDGIKAKTDSLTFTVAGDVDCNVQTWKGAAAQDMTGDAFARLGAPAGASVSADIAAVKTETASILTDTAEIGAAGAGLTAIPWNASWDAEVQSEVFDALDAAFTDATSLTGNGLLDRIRTLCWILRNKIEVTDANGNTVIYKDDSTTAAFTVNAMLTDDSTTTTRLRAA